MFIPYQDRALVGKYLLSTLEKQTKQTNWLFDLWFPSERSQSFEMFFALVVVLNAVVAGFRAETWHGTLFPAGFHLGKSYQLVGQFCRLDET